MLKILLPHTFIESNCKLVHLLENRLQKSTKIISVQRKYFNESKGLDSLKDLCFGTSKISELEHSNKYYALACVSALMSYIEFTYSKTFHSK